MNENIVIFFLTWIGLGVIYFGVKSKDNREVYENENNIGKALTIFLGGPAVWIFGAVFFLGKISTKQIEFLNKLNKYERDK